MIARRRSLNNGGFRIPPELKKSHPLLTAASLRMLKRLQEHPDAPRWTYRAGDYLTASELRTVVRFRTQLNTARRPRKANQPSPAILARLHRLQSKVPLFRERVPRGVAPTHLPHIWGQIATMGREDVALRPERLVPDDLDLERMMVYRTAGATGHALLVPNDRIAVACYQPFLEFALARYGVRPRFGPDRVACFLVCAQKSTVTYATVLSYFKGAGFAKLNLNPEEWPGADSPHRFFREFQPAFLTGDPISFAEMLRMKIPAKPMAMVSTAVALSQGLKQRLSEAYRCPVIDWYSLTETGPIGYACPKNHGYHLLPHDVHIEAVAPDGKPVSPGEIGEITVTGGRNPFLPLLRYRTGDWGRLDFGRCPCGDRMPRILDLEGRGPILFRTSHGTVVNPVDVSRVLREFPFVQHEFIQQANLECELVARPISKELAPDQVAVEQVLRVLFGPGISVNIRYDYDLGSRADGGKVIPYRSELLLAD